VFDLSPNAPIIVAGADADSRICALSEGGGHSHLDLLAGVGDICVRRKAEGLVEVGTIMNGGGIEEMSDGHAIEIA
jgi:hypothetical protein